MIITTLSDWSPVCLQVMVEVMLVSGYLSLVSFLIQRPLAKSPTGFMTVFSLDFLNAISSSSASTFLLIPKPAGPVLVSHGVSSLLAPAGS